MPVRERIIRILQEDLGLREECIKPDSRFEEDLGLDSLDLLELVMIIEEDFRIEIEDEEAEKLRTVNDLVNWVEGHPTK